MDKLKIVFFVASSLFAVFSTVMIFREQDKISHRLDTRDAYFNTGLIKGAEAREKALIEHRRFNERILAHCRAQADGCKLPNDLTVLPSEPKFDSIEFLLTSNREH